MSEHIRSRSMILPPNISEEDASAVADRLNFARIADRRFDTNSGQRREVIWEVAPGLTVHYAEDAQSNSRFVQVMGDDVNDVADISEALAEILNPNNYDDLLNSYRDSKNSSEKASHLLRVALGAPPEYDEEFYTIVNDALRSDDEVIRKAALLAVTYYGLPQFIPTLRTIVQEDSTLSNLARDVLRTYEEAGLA